MRAGLWRIVRWKGEGGVRGGVVRWIGEAKCGRC